VSVFASKIRLKTSTFGGMDASAQIISLLIGYFIAIFAIVNPITAMPVFLVLTEGNTAEERNHQAMKAAFFMIGILVSFLLGGTYIVSFFGISMEGIRIAGGIMITSWAFTLLNPKDGGRKLDRASENEAREKHDISFSPLAMPLLSGPGSIAVVMSFASQELSITNYILIIAAIVLTALGSYVVLRLAPKIVRVLGKTGMNGFTRMMGFIALCIGVQFIINGIRPILG
jgi:multiple antibiotic resistance protein